MPDKIGVLYLHSQNGFGADSAIHGHLMRNLDRERFVVHVACSRGDRSGTAPALEKFRQIPDVRLRPTHFAPGFRQRSPRDVLRQFRSAAASPFEAVALAAYVRRHRVRILHGSDRPRDCAYGMALARLTGAKSVVHVHVAWSNGYSAPARWAVRNADAVFSISRFVTSTIVGTGTPAERVHTILNGIDPDAWDPQTDGSPLRRELGIPPDAPLIVSVSRLFPQKGQRELLRAFARVSAEVPSARLLIVGGEAPWVRGTFLPELQALAAELGVKGRVVLAGERPDIPRVMAAADVFAMPSFEEPFGLVFLEAMIMRRPVVSLNNGGTPEVVDHGGSGFLAPPGDIEVLARHILSLLHDPGLRARMGAHGRARVLERFTARRMAADAARAYESLVQDRGVNVH
jgi:glycosyltransferase involved in cell wall biosynthesis